VLAVLPRFGVQDIISIFKSLAFFAAESTEEKSDTDFHGFTGRDDLVLPPRLPKATYVVEAKAHAS
jgi:hypothetical protein